MNLSEVLSRIKPTTDDREKVNRVVSKVLERLRGLDAEVHGSFRKDTWLRGDADVDVFVFFPQTMGKEWMKGEALTLIVQRFSGMDYAISYAEHPYLTVRIEGVEVDVVPAFRIPRGQRPITAVDRTPFHTEFVLAHTDERTRDEVRLLKQFMKGIGVYGAEIKVQGFSGYVAELLVIAHSSFEETLRAASSWRHPVVVDKLVKPLREFSEPLVIPDPTDPLRNAASAVSVRSLATFVLASTYYLKSPSLEFFFPSDHSGGEIKGDLILFRVDLERRVPQDLLWGQIRRSCKRAVSLLKQAGYGVIDWGAWGNEESVTLAFQLETLKLPKYYLHRGPMYYQRDSVEEFVSRNDQVWIDEEGRMCTIKQRREVEAEELIRSSITLKPKFRISKIEKGDEPWVSKFLRKTPSWLK